MTRVNVGKNMVELEAKRMRKAVELSTLKSELEQATIVVKEEKDRLVAAHRTGQADKVKAEIAHAQVVFRDRPAEVEAVQQDVLDIDEEQRALRNSDEGYEHYNAEAHKASELAAAKLVEARAVYGELEQVWTDAASRWTEQRIAAKARGEGEYAPPEVPTGNIQPPVGHGVGHLEPWPAGRRSLLDEILERRANAKRREAQAA